MKLLIIMEREPFTHEFNTLVRLTEAGISRNHSIQIFLLGNGVYCLLKKELKELTEKGVKVHYCSHNATQRGVNPENWAESNSTYGLAKLIKEADKVINLK